MTDDESPIRIAVIGSGPAGFYAAGHLLKDAAGRFEVDMLERLPTPWGLVRSGVAADHPKIKSVTRIYEKTATHPRFRYFGNVTFGEHVSREDLLERYHAIVYATGSPADRPLGIPGEDLPGSHAATECVGWYNGPPDHTDLELDLLSARRAVVIGNGNVALDVARMLVLDPSELAPTDTPAEAVGVRGGSGVDEGVVCGRRGPAQAAFTNPELLELGELADADVIVDADELERALTVADPDSEAAGTARRGRARPQRARAWPVWRLACAGDRRARDDHRWPCVPRDRLPRDSAPRRSLRRARRGHLKRGRACDRPRHGRAAGRRVRGRLDQARSLGRDRHEQEGRPGDRQRDARRPLVARREQRRSAGALRRRPIRCQGSGARARRPRPRLRRAAAARPPARPGHVLGLGSDRSP